MTEPVLILRTDAVFTTVTDTLLIEAVKRVTRSDTAKLPQSASQKEK
jgi:hypothetical protein